MLSHALLTLLVQALVGLTTGRWIVGGATAICFFAGREIAQAEYRWIQNFGTGKRANMPWWGGLDPAAWTAKSALDVALPIAVTLMVYLLVRFLLR